MHISGYSSHTIVRTAHKAALVERAGAGARPTASNLSVEPSDFVFNVDMVRSHCLKLQITPVVVILEH